MQRNKLSFKGQNIYVGIDVHLKTWHVTTVTESGYKYSFAQHSDARELFDRLNRKFPDAHFVSAYEAGFCGFSAHYALTELGFENIVVHAADIPTTGKEKAMKADAVDSEKIAWSLKRGELKGIYVKDKKYMDDTNLMRLRQRFVTDLSRQKNRTKHLLYTQGVTYPERFRKNRTHWSRNFMSWLRDEVDLLSEEKLSLVLLCDQVENTRRSILAADYHEMCAIASVHLRNNKAFGQGAELAKSFRKTELDKQTVKMQMANAALINALQGGKDYSNGATQWDGAEQAMVPSEYKDKPSNGKFMFKMNTMGWSMSDKHYSSWKEAIENKFGKGKFTVPQTKEATSNYGG